VAHFEGQPIRESAVRTRLALADGHWLTREPTCGWTGGTPRHARGGPR
jgi:hypothetical protein